jgi:nicotinamidase-related amidase
MTPFVDPDYRRSALVTIDVQCDTLDGQPLEVPGTSQMLPRLGELVNAFRSARRPWIHVVRIYKRDGSNADLCRRQEVLGGAPWLHPDSAGVQLAPEIVTSSLRLDCDRLLANQVQTVGEGEYIVYKPRWGAFYRTPLEALLRATGVNTLVFAGCNFPNCPRTSIYEASERDYRVVLARDAISGLYEAGAEELRNIGVQLHSVTEIAASLAVVAEEAPPAPASRSGFPADSTPAEAVVALEAEEWRDASGQFVISTDRARLDLELIHGFLRESYWSPGVPLAIVRRAIQGSLVFGVYTSSGQQAGFARIVSDGSTFAYLADVFVVEAYRSQGLSKWLLSVIVAHPRLQNLRRWMLATRDAHGLYAKFGFTPLAAPERFMQRHDPGVYARLRAPDGESG